jgi:hypothetical protein
MLQRIFDTQNLGEANLIISILTAKGIRPPPLRSQPHISAAGIEMSYGIEVPAELVGRAQEALRPYGYAQDRPV